MKRHYLTNLLSLATLLMLLATAMPSFAQDADPADEPASPESYQPTLPKNDDGFYVIASDSDYETFREIVASGNPYANAVLTADIMVRNPIGSGEEHAHYRGTFDGQGHTVTLEGSTGLFEYAKPGCVVRSIKVSGTTDYKTGYAGSIVHDATGTRIDNCISDAIVLGEKRGGLVGIARGECFLENCAFIGKLPGAQERSGLVGENSQTVCIKSCYVAPDFHQYSVNFKVPNIITDRMEYYEEEVDGNVQRKYQTSLNNYFTYRYVDYSHGNEIDKVSLELPDYATEIDDADLSSGKLCYMLNRNGKNGVVWYQNGDYPYPFPIEGGVFFISTDDGKTVEGVERCNHHYSSAAAQFCSYCGAVKTNAHPEPLQNRNGYTIDNISYAIYRGSGTMVAAVTGIASSQKAVCIPESINMQGTEMSVIAINTDAFRDNTAIEYCSIPKSVTSVHENAFFGCTSLQYIHIADGDYSAEKETAKEKALWFDANVFTNCPSLKNVYVGRDMKWAEDSNGPFATNANIAEIYWGANVSHVGNLTEGAESTQFAIGSENTNKIFFLGNDKSLANEVEVCSYSTMSNCKDFYINRNVVGNYFTTENNGGGLFDGCETVVFGPSVKTIAAKAFKGTEASPKPLKMVDISKAYNLETIGDEAFYCCANFTSSFPFNITKVSSFGKSAFAGSGITGVAFNDYITEIPDFAFVGCKNLVRVNIPASIETIGVYAFGTCGLNMVIIEDGDKELDLTKAQFYGSTGINNVYLGRAIKLNEHNILQDAYSFIPSSGAIWTIGDKITKLPDYLFPLEKYDGITFLHSEEPLHFSDYFNTTAKVITLDRVLVCDKDNKEALPFTKEKNDKIEGVSFGTNITNIPANMFEGCSIMRSLMIPDNIAVIGSNAFKGCSKLDVACIMGTPNVGVSAFEDCINLRFLYLLGKSITLADGAFHNCNSLAEIIPSFPKDSDTGSSPSAFDQWAYDNTVLESRLSFSSDPWKNFSKVYLNTLTYSYPVTDGNVYDQPFDKASIPFPSKLSTGRYDLIYVPFDMDSYYFGADAEIHWLQMADEFMCYSLEEDSENYAEHSTSNLVVKFEEENLDEDHKLRKGNIYLVKINKEDYEEASLGAYFSLFESDGIDVDNRAKTIEGQSIFFQDRPATIHCGYHYHPKIQGTEENKFFIVDEGVIKCINGSFDVGERVIFEAEENQKDFTISFQSLISSKVDLTFNELLEGYSSFYAADYNYIAPSWCEVYIVTSADGESVTLEKIEDRTITKGQSVLIKSQNDETNEYGLKEHLNYATHGSSATDLYSRNLLKGVDVETPVSDLDREFVYVLSRTAGNSTGFYKYDKTLKAGKAYLDPEGLSPENLAKSCLFTFKDAATGIKSTSESRSESDQAIYDLMGRRLKDAGFKGIYIVNGKKVVIK